MRQDQTWFGVGAKVGGIAVLGMEAFQGVATRIDSFSTWQEVNVTGLRLGLGLGGGINAALFCAFNSPTLYSVNGQFVSDWGINVAFPAVKANAKGLGAALDLARFLDGPGRAFLEKPFIHSLTPDKMSSIRDWLALVYNSASNAAGAPADRASWAAVIDLPVGTGLELSAFLSGGEIQVGGQVSV